MIPYFRPLEAHHVLGLPRFHAYVATLGGVGGTDKLPPILTRIFPPVEGDEAEGELVKRYSQSLYCRPRKDVEVELEEKTAEMGEELDITRQMTKLEGEEYGGTFPVQLIRKRPPDRKVGGGIGQENIVLPDCGMEHSPCRSCADYWNR